MQKREIRIIKFQHLHDQEVQFTQIKQTHQIYLLICLIIVHF
jgi:hypothetical protein